MDKAALWSVISGRSVLIRWLSLLEVFFFFLLRKFFFSKWGWLRQRGRHAGVVCWRLCAFQLICKISFRPTDVSVCWVNLRFVRFCSCHVFPRLSVRKSSFFCILLMLNHSRYYVYLLHEYLWHFCSVLSVYNFLTRFTKPITNRRWTQRVKNLNTTFFS